VSQASGT